MSFSVQNLTEATATNNTLYNLATVPNASLIATTFVLPYSISLVPGTTLVDFLNVLTATNFFNPSGEFYPEISGNFLISWSFSVQLTAGSETPVIAQVHSGIKTNSFNFNATSTPVTYNFTSILPCAGFGGEEDGIQFQFNSPATITINLLSNFLHISYISELIL